MPAADSLSTSRISATKRANPAGRGRDNHRNGSYPKTVLTEDGTVDLDVPRDRNGTFDPQIVPKGETRLDGFDDNIISMYARGMTVREIQGHLRELYAVDVSPDLISRVTDAVLDEVREWQNRPLDAIYPVIFFDALRVKIHDEGVVRTRQQPFEGHAGTFADPPHDPQISGRHWRTTHIVLIFEIEIIRIVGFGVEESLLSRFVVDALFPSRPREGIRFKPIRVRVLLFDLPLLFPGAFF